MEDPTAGARRASSARAWRASPVPSSSAPSTPPAHPRGALRAALAELGARGVAATPRALYAALWTFTDARGRAWPSQETLARVTGRCVRTVRAALGDLERARAIARDVPTLTDRRRRRRTTAYLLLPLVSAPSSRPSDPSKGLPPTNAPPAGEAPAVTGLPSPARAADLHRELVSEAPAEDLPEGPTLEWVEEDLPELVSEAPAVTALPSTAPELRPADGGPPPPATPTGAPEGADASAEDLPELVSEAPVAAPATPSAAPSITGNGRPRTTGNGALQKTPGMNTIPASARPMDTAFRDFPDAPTRARKVRPSPFAAPSPTRTRREPPPPPSAPLAAVLARCVALTRGRAAG